MSSFLDYLLPFLQFSAILLSALSGVIGLLHELNKDGHITKWGRRALVGVIISFIIAATTQAIGIYRSKEASIAEQEKTQKILFEISRGIYEIDVSKMSFDVIGKISAKNKYFENYSNRVLVILRNYQMNPGSMLPKGVEEIPQFDENGAKGISTRFYIYPESNLFPDSVSEKDIFDLIGQIAIDIKIYKSDSLNNFFPSLGKKPNLSFSTLLLKPSFEFNTTDTTISMVVTGLKANLESFESGNKGGVESLMDLADGLVKISLADYIIEGLSHTGVEASKKLSIENFSFNVSNRKFSSNSLCEKFNRGWTNYYLKLPQNTLQTELNIVCNY